MHVVLWYDCLCYSYLYYLYVWNVMLLNGNVMTSHHLRQVRQSYDSAPRMNNEGNCAACVFCRLLILWGLCHILLLDEYYCGICPVLSSAVRD